MNIFSRLFSWLRSFWCGPDKVAPKPVRAIKYVKPAFETKRDFPLANEAGMIEGVSVAWSSIALNVGAKHFQWAESLASKALKRQIGTFDMQLSVDVKDANTATATFKVFA